MNRMLRAACELPLTSLQSCTRKGKQNVDASIKMHPSAPDKVKSFKSANVKTHSSNIQARQQVPQARDRTCTCSNISEAVWSHHSRRWKILPANCKAYKWVVQKV